MPRIEMEIRHLEMGIIIVAVFQALVKLPGIPPSAFSAIGVLHLHIFGAEIC